MMREKTVAKLGPLEGHEVVEPGYPQGEASRAGKTTRTAPRNESGLQSVTKVHEHQAIFSGKDDGQLPVTVTNRSSRVRHAQAVGPGQSCVRYRAGRGEPVSNLN
jgi:hypothetical protein